MSDNRGLPNVNSEGVPDEDLPERFEAGDQDAHEAEPARARHESEPGSEPAETGSEPAEPPPADFDPAQNPSNPDLVKKPEQPD